MQMMNSKLKNFNMIILDVFSDFSSVESEFSIEETFSIKLTLVSISHMTFIKPKRAAILFYKKVVPLNFGFDSLRNEQNFLSNQKARKLMNVTRKNYLMIIGRICQIFIITFVKGAH